MMNFAETVRADYKNAPEDYDQCVVHLIPFSKFDIYRSSCYSRVDLLKDGEVVYTAVAHRPSYGEVITSDILAHELVIISHLVRMLPPPKQPVRFIVYDPVSYLTFTRQMPPVTNSVRANVTHGRGYFRKYIYPFTIEMGDPSVAAAYAEYAFRPLRSPAYRTIPTDEITGYNHKLGFEEECQNRMNS